MTPQLIAIYALGAMFAVATIWRVNMGVLAFVGAFLVGTLGAGMKTTDIIAGFPDGLFLTLVAPIALGFAARHGINPLMMGLFVIHGAQAGGFSPISIYGGITNTIVTKAGLPLNALFTFLASLGINVAVAFLLFFLMGGCTLLAANAGAAEAVPHHAENVASPQTGGSRAYQMITLAGLLSLAVLVLAYKLDIGFVAITIGLVLSLIAPNVQKSAIGQVSRPEIMLITGVSTYVAVPEKMRTIAFVDHSVAGLTSPMLTALLLCFIGAVVLAFASSTAVLGSLIPLAVPFLQAGTGINPVGFIGAMAVSSTIVDVSPFSTNGAIVLATARNVDRDAFFRRLLGYGAAVTVLAPIVVWLLFVVIG